MRRIESIEDQMRDIQTWELSDGRCVRIDGRAARKFGVARILHDMGLGEDPAKMPRKPVFQHGRKVGTLPGSFDPQAARSLSFLYDPRPGDFVEHEGGWRAAPSLGPGDLDAIEGFSRS